MKLSPKPSPDISTQKLVARLPVEAPDLTDIWTALAKAGGWKPPARVIQRGDVWQCGNHRIKCGDSSSAADVRKLMNGQKAAMMFTSPPYLDVRTYISGAPVCFDTLMNGVGDCLSLALKPDGQALFNYGRIVRDGRIVRYYNAWIDYMESIGWRMFDEYVWQKPMGKPYCQYRLINLHENILHFNIQNKNPLKTVEKKCKSGFPRIWRNMQKDGSMNIRNFRETLVRDDVRRHESVFKAAPDKSNGIRGKHPARFPVTLCEKIIPIWSNVGEIVYEPFCGSGTMILASEHLNRRCYAMEIEPQYVEIALQAFEEETGVKPVIIK